MNAIVDIEVLPHVADDRKDEDKMNYTTVQLKEILAKHAEWLADNSKGVRADLSGADLSGVNLSGFDLCGANLSYTDLRGAHLIGANLNSADLSGANLRGAYLIGAYLIGANLNSADLRGANMDYSSGIPLWCGGAKFKCEAKLIQQVLAHLCTLDCGNKEWIALRKAIRPFAEKSHRASDLGLVKQKKG